MANTITGKVIAFSSVETIPSKDPSKQPMMKRQLFLDCTRYDQYTGERGYENTPLFDFGGKVLEKLETLIQNGLKKDDIVTISFDIQGSKYEKDNKMQIFTRIRPYDIELFQPKNQQQAANTAQPSQSQHHVPTGTTSDGSDDLPF